MEVRSKVSGMCVHKCKVKAMLNADCKKEKGPKMAVSGRTLSI